MTHSPQETMKERPIPPKADRDVLAAQRLAEQAWALEHLKTEWMDEHYYKSLAATYGLRCARWWKPASETRYIKRALKTAGKDGAWFRDTFGYAINEFHIHNPKVPAWVAQCLVLELASYENKEKVDYAEQR